MLISCARCGKIHERGKCSVPTTGRKNDSRVRKFRSSAAWTKCARAVRYRDNNLCLACLHEDPPRYTSAELSVHHIVPIHEDWDLRLEESNCATLCAYHHSLAEAGMIARDELKSWVDGSRSPLK